MSLIVLSISFLLLTLLQGLAVMIAIVIGTKFFGISCNATAGRTLVNCLLISGCITLFMLFFAVILPWYGVVILLFFFPIVWTIGLVSAFEFESYEVLLVEALVVGWGLLAWASGWQLSEICTRWG
jgi:hypothetical protein